MKTNKSKYSQNSGFKIPEDYLGSFEEKILRRLEINESGTIPSKEKVFSVPNTYFDTLEDKIIAKTETRKPRVVRLIRKEYLYYAAAVAAMFVLMLNNFFHTGSEQPIGWDDIEISAMETYIDEGYEMGYIELNSAEVSDFVFENDRLIDDSDFKTVNSDAVFEYIDENIEDPAYILE